jgi:archaellum biogenesis ATPase FlaH
MKLENKNLNLIVGKIGSGKTPYAVNIANDELKNGGNVIYVTTDASSVNIKRCVHCLYNDVNFIDVKYAKDEKTPTNLILPPNLTVIDDKDTLEGIFSTIDEVSKTMNGVDLIVIDNINFIKDETEKSYKDRIDWINMKLQEFALNKSVKILATLNLLYVVDNEPADFMFKDMGQFALIERGKEITEFKLTLNNDPKSTIILSMSFKNLKMSEVDTSIELTQEEYFGG